MHNRYLLPHCRVREWGVYTPTSDVYCNDNVLILARSELEPSMSDCPVFLDIAIPSVKKTTYII